MNFFEHQENARRAGKRLIVLFVLAVMAVVVAVNFVGAFLYLGFLGAPLPNGFFLTNTLVTVGLIGGGTWLETQRLASGGEAVARMVGARAVDPSTGDLLERRLVNVVEEMAIASGVSVPRVYLMNDEPGINAFAAGHSVNDAIIAVTRGTLTRLTRDELQGVVAHEFSHILNGDMRLNVRLIGVLFGLTMLATFGRFLMEMSRGSRDSKGGASALVLAGLALFVIGYIGVFFGRLIKAGVSRSREFLADASAVQFTRNPDGIGGALRKIGGLAEGRDPGSAIRHPHAETLSHLFLGAARRNFASGWLATHPPLQERIQRIYGGRALGFVAAPELPVSLALAGADAAPPVPPLPFTRETGIQSPLAGLVAGSAGTPPLTEAIGTVTRRAGAAPRTADAVLARLGLLDAVSDSIQAQLLALGLLVDKDQPTLQDEQRRVLAEALGSAAVASVERFHRIAQQLPPGARLPVLDLLAPTLRRLPLPACERLLLLGYGLIHADGRLTLAEFLLFTVLKRRIGAAGRRAAPARYQAVSELAAEAALVLSLIASVRMRSDDMTHMQRAFNAGILLLPGVDAALMPPAALALEAVDAALDRLNQLKPLAKPVFIKACTAVAFCDGTTHWKAASCLRTVCAALDAPLPPQLLDAESEERAAA
jgi:Zn-dependent protease with chaperone function